MVPATAFVTVDGPVGLLVAMLIPDIFTRTFGDPPVYRGLGMIAWGTADGFAPPQPLKSLTNIYYPIPDGMTVVGLTLRLGVSCVLTELIFDPSKTVALLPAFP